MPSSPSTNLRFEKQATGENLNLWGERLNTVIDLVEEALTGRFTKSLTTNYTLVSTNYLSDEARPMALFFTDGGLSAAPTITIPSANKLYLVRNGGSTYNINISCGGTSAAVRPSIISWVYCDGTDCYVLDTTLDKIKSAAANLSLNSHKITDLADPENDQDATTKAWIVNTYTSAIDLANDWADKTTDYVSGTENSAKSWAVGGTSNGQPAAGDAKSWATKTSATVDGSTYSAKEFSQGSQSGTGGSAKNWSQQTGADVTGAAANSRSAKSWAQDANTGATLGGSAKDWAQTTGGTVDGTEYASKEYASGTTVATGSAKQWATKTGSAVASSEYSAKEHAVGTSVSTGSAKDWATKTSGEVVTSEGYGAKKYAQDAASSASDAASSASDSASSATASASSASAAATSASAADASATAAQSSADDAALASGLQWAFSTTTGMADPSAGNVRLNNATIASASAIAISASTSLTGNPDASDFIAAWDDSTSTSKGYLIIRKSASPETFAIFSITGTVIDNSTWFQVPVSYVSGNGSFSVSDTLIVEFSRTGDSGQAGGGGLNPFGDGSDGDVTVSGSLTLSRDMFYNNLTVSSGAAIAPNGWRIFVRGTLDLSSAPAGAFTTSGANGGAASGKTGGTQAAVGVSQTTRGRVSGGAGKSGQTSSTTSGSAGGDSTNGGGGGSGGASGAGATSAGAAISAGASNRAGFTLTMPPGQVQTSTSTSTTGSGSAGAGAAAGGGSNSTQSGGGSGGSGGGAGALVIVAKTVARGTNTTAGILQAKGGDAGASGNGESGGNTGGGGGSGGGGGGMVLLICETLTGSTITNAIDVSGGAGGAGGNGQGTGSGGDGGGSGSSGLVVLWPTGSSQTVTLPVAGSSGSAHSGTSGGAGHAANTKQVDL